MKEKHKLFGWFWPLALTVSGLAFIIQLRQVISFEKKLLFTLATIPAVGFIFWLFIKTGFASWAEKWIKSSLDDFFKEVEKGKNKKLK